MTETNPPQPNTSEQSGEATESTAETPDATEPAPEPVAPAPETPWPAETAPETPASEESEEETAPQTAEPAEPAGETAPQTPEPAEPAGETAPQTPEPAEAAAETAPQTPPAEAAAETAPQTPPAEPAGEMAPVTVESAEAAPQAAEPGEPAAETAPQTPPAEPAGETAPQTPEPAEAAAETAPQTPEPAEPAGETAPQTPEPAEAAAETAPQTPPAEPPAAEAAPETSAPAVPTPASIPKPSAIPTPAALARAVPRPPAAVAPAVETDHSASAAFGRVDENGAVFVRTREGEKEVGSYPGATNDEALTYFARKYDELYASAVLLEQRLEQPEVPSKDVAEGLKTLQAQVGDANVVGDLDALASKVDAIQSGLAAKRATEQQQRADARAAATVERERIVAEAEAIAAQPESKVQWKQSGARMRELLDEWKSHQRSATRLDRQTESALWQRFSAARNSFDKARRTHFAGLDAAHADAKSAKERLAAEAEGLSSSKDWAATAGAFKRLMDEWRRAGRASRADDDRLWGRFKAAQDAFFAAKDAVVAAEEEQFRGNLAIKEALLLEAEAVLPITDLEKAKAQMRVIQDKWDAAGKVPRADMDRIEKAMRRIEQAVRDAEDRKWKSSNPEVAARAQGMVDQLERAVADLKADLARAEASGNPTKVRKAQEALDARQAWLDQARAGVREFGG